MQAIGRQPQRAPDGALVHYERHRPEQTTLFLLVQQHAATFFAQAEDAAGADLPQRVKDQFVALLECGILAHASCARAALTVGTPSGSPSVASDAAFAHRAVPGAWRRRRRTWSTTSSPMCRCAIGCCDAIKTETVVAKRNAMIMEALVRTRDEVLAILRNHQTRPWAMKVGVTTVHRSDDWQEARSTSVKLPAKAATQLGPLGAPFRFLQRLGSVGALYMRSHLRR